METLKMIEDLATARRAMNEGDVKQFMSAFKRLDRGGVFRLLDEYQRDHILTPPATTARRTTSDRPRVTDTTSPRIFTATSGSGGDYTPSSCNDGGSSGGGCE